jgi:hypothetical protein
VGQSLRCGKYHTVSEREWRFGMYFISGSERICIAEWIMQTRPRKVLGVNSTF